MNEPGEEPEVAEEAEEAEEQSPDVEGHGIEVEDDGVSPVLDVNFGCA